MITPSNLTTREMEILQAVADGLSTKEIAAKYSVSKNTINVHRHNIIKKSRCGNMTEAVAKHLRVGIIA
jgi:DNA-binding NarL/FixJ family response regulator